MASMPMFAVVMYAVVRDRKAFDVAVDRQRLAAAGLQISQRVSADRDVSQGRGSTVPTTTSPNACGEGVPQMPSWVEAFPVFQMWWM